MNYVPKNSKECSLLTQRLPVICVSFVIWVVKASKFYPQVEKAVSLIDGANNWCLSINKDFYPMMLDYM